MPCPHLRSKRWKVSKPVLLSGVIQSDGLGPPQRGEEQSLSFGEESREAGDVEAISLFSSSQRA